MTALAEVGFMTRPFAAEHSLCIHALHCSGLTGPELQSYSVYSDAPTWPLRGSHVQKITLSFSQDPHDKFVDWKGACLGFLKQLKENVNFF